MSALLLCVVAFAGGAACSSTSSKPAATVNGKNLPTQALVDELNAIGDNGDYINTLSGTVKGSTPGSFDAAFVAQVLKQQINYSIVHEEFVRENLKPDDACRNQARDELFQQLGGQNRDATAGESLYNKFNKQYQDLLVQRNTELLALEYALAGQTCGVAVDAQGYYNAHPADFTKLCISLIAVADQATADSVIAQARAGADFATLARNNSIDDQSKANGGDIGCRLPSEFNENVAQLLEAAQTGDVLDAIPGQSGFSVVKITDRQLVALADAQSTAEELASVDLGKAFSSWIQQARVDASVTVDARYGTWDQANFTINPPALDANASSPNSSSSSSSFSSSPSTDAP